jgi:hypothetical protein
MLQGLRLPKNGAQRSIQRVSIRYLKWLRTGWRLVRRWRGIIGVLSALLRKSRGSRGASISAIGIFGRSGLVIADDGKNLCHNACMQSR